MYCARLQLQVRSKPVVRRVTPSDKPQRYCQKRMVNPEQCDDHRWNAVLERFHYNPTIFEEYNYKSVSASARPEEDLCLTIQNLKFQGNVQERTRPRTSFKYKSLSGNRKHRMFVKQVVDEITSFDEDRSSELSSYYFDDYVKYILSADRSRPSSSKSSIFLQELSNKYRENKPIQEKKLTDTKTIRKVENKTAVNKSVTVVDDSENKPLEKNNNIEDTKIAYHKTGKRKSLTISRVPSPETIQVIRVDVVCNYGTSSVISDYDENKIQTKDITKLTDKEIEKMKIKSPHFADKYLLTNTVKSIDEKLSCGSKVTLLCKTFKLTDRRKKSRKIYGKPARKSVQKL